MMFVSFRSITTGATSRGGTGASTFTFVFLLLFPLLGRGVSCCSIFTVTYYFVLIKKFTVVRGSCFINVICIIYILVSATISISHESGRFGALKSDSTHHFFRNTCTKSGSLRFSGCWLILSVYILMRFDSLCKIVRSSVVLLLPLFRSSTTCVPSGAGTVYRSGASAFTYVFLLFWRGWAVHVAQYLLVLSIL